MSSRDDGGLRVAVSIHKQSVSILEACGVAEAACRLLLALVEEARGVSLHLPTSHLLKRTLVLHSILLECNHPKDPCHWDEIIPMDGGWLPHWDEALDESTGIIEAVYFAPHL